MSRRREEGRGSAFLRHANAFDRDVMAAGPLQSCARQVSMTVASEAGKNAKRQSARPATIRG